MPTPPLPPPPRHEPLTIVVKGLKVVVPTAAVVALAMLLTPGLAYLVVPKPQPEVGPVPLPVPQVPLQTWAAGAMPAYTPVAVISGKLPSPLPNQKTKGCDEDLGEKAIAGGCWMPTDKKPPCPRHKLWEHEGRCWRPIPQAARPPTTGEPRTAPVAAPE